MAVDEKDPERRIKFEVRRRKLSGVDNGIRHFDQYTPAGRVYQSVTSTIPVGAEPHILSVVKEPINGIEPLIAVTVTPTDMPIPELPEIASYECTTQYFNQSSRAIRVTFKNNITITLAKPKFWNHHNVEHVIVRRVHRFGNADVARSVLFNHQTDSKFISIEDEERQIILNQISEQNRTGGFRNHMTSVMITIDRLIPIELFKEHVGIYVSDLDVMFRQDEVGLPMLHPTSQDAILNGELLNKFGEHCISGKLYNIVDNESHYLPKYVCLGNDVVQIPTSRDPGKESGIYVIDIDNIKYDNVNIKLTHHPLDKSENLGVYSTKEEAATKGRLNESYKLELAQAERELGRIKAETLRLEHERNEAESRLTHARNTEKIQMERASSYISHNAQVEEMMAKMKAREKQDALDKIASERKDYYEDRSYGRKDTSEILKWVPTILSGIVSVAAFLIFKRKVF